jgi:hypothetical protein
MPELIDVQDVKVGDVVVVHVGGDPTRVDGPHAVMGAKWMEPGPQAEPRAGRAGPRWDLYTDKGIVEVWEDDEVYKV